MSKVRAEGECVVFTGKTNRRGYGRTSVQRDGQTVEIMAHRVVYEHHRGPIPDGLGILHSCDNPPCVNIAHLRAGTPLENSADMVERLRSRAPNTDKDTCKNGHDLIIHGVPRRTRSRNPAKEPGLKCGQCQREEVREHKLKVTGKPYLGHPFNRDKTYCKRGHDLADAHIKRSGGRQCMVCVAMGPEGRYRYDLDHGLPVDPRTARRYQEAQ